VRQDGSVVLTFTLLALAVLALWGRGEERAPAWRRNSWLLLLGASLVSALAAGIVRPAGLGWIVLLAAAAYGFSRPGAGRWQRAVAAGATLGLAVGLFAHRLPGFENPRVIFAVKFSPDAIPYTLYLNFDKTIIGLFILGWCHPLLTGARDWRTMLRAAAPWAGG
jgi:hypothetical protein